MKNCLRFQLGFIPVFLIFLIIIMWTQPLSASDKTVGFYCIKNSNGLAPALADVIIQTWLASDPMDIQTGPTGTNIKYSQEGPMMEPNCGTVTVGLNGTFGWTPSGVGATTIHVLVTANGESSHLQGAIEANWDTPVWFEGDYSLPVELASFTAEYEDQSVILNWVTYSETNLSGFNLYRSLDYKDHFEKINTALILGAGNTSEMHEYQFRDQNIMEDQTYFYQLETIDTDGETDFHGPIAVSTGGKPDVPKAFYLSQNHPNPSNPRTMIQYQLPEARRVMLSIYNILGEEIVTLVNRQEEAGIYQVTWDGKDRVGLPVSTSLYFYRLEAGEHVFTKKLMLIK